MNKRLFFESLYLILLGGFSSLSLPPYNFFIINFLTFSLFFIFLFNKKKKSIQNKFFFIYGWLFGFGYFITNLYWISISLTFDEGFKFLIPISIILIPSFLAIFYGIITYLYYLIKIKKIISSFFLLSLLFGVLETIRGYVLTGFPWNLIAFSFSDQTQFIQIISLIGTYAFNMFCISLFMSPAIFILKENKKDIVVCILFLITPIFILGYGYLYEKKFYSSEIKNNNFIIRAVGSNIGIERFYGKDESLSIIKELIELSNLDPDKKIFLVWPEGIIPNITKNKLGDFKNLFGKQFSKNHYLGLGINNQAAVGKKLEFYNSFAIYDNELNLLNSYNKIKLVPFGEFLPFENILKKLGFKTLTNNYQSYSSGLRRNIMKLNYDESSLRILPLICYEIIYSGEISNDNKFDYIVNISEDGWFGKSIGPTQHFVHSIFRSIESGKYVIRSSNNGISAIINPIGIVEKEITFGQKGYIDLEKSRTIKPTLFSKFGNKIFLIVILLYIFFIFSFNKSENE